MKELKQGIKKYMLLERLALTALGLSDLCHVLLTTPYITSGIVDKKMGWLERMRNRAESEAIERRRVIVWLSKLKHDGFVEQKNLMWRLTEIGRHELNRLRRRVGLAMVYAKPVKSDMVKIVSFDIPEKMRGHRNWLRFALKNLRFRMLHKSVWIAKVALPEVFIKEIQLRKLTDYIEIMGITKQGTMHTIL